MRVNNYFSEDVSLFLKLNGFNQINISGLHDGMLWQKENKAVQFWQNRIEAHRQNKLLDWQVKNTYIGFDGKNMQHLIMILHCMDIIKISDAVVLAEHQSNNADHVQKIINSKPLTSSCQR
jgi:hypothetical protein